MGGKHKNTHAVKENDKYNEGFMVTVVDYLALRKLRFMLRWFEKKKNISTPTILITGIMDGGAGGAGLFKQTPIGFRLCAVQQLPQFFLFF